MGILILPEGPGLVLFSNRVREATVGVFAVGALSLRFQVKLCLAMGKKIPAGLHAAEASCGSSSSLGTLRAAIVGAVWSSKASCKHSCDS